MLRSANSPFNTQFFHRGLLLKRPTEDMTEAIHTQDLVADDVFFTAGSLVKIYSH